VVIGRVTEDGVMRIRDGERIAAEVPARFLTDECPVYYREEQEAEYYQRLRQFDPAVLPLPQALDQVLLQLLAAPNIASKQWVFEQYDHMVGINTAVPPGAGDAAVLRLKEAGSKGIALKTDCNSRFCYLDPYWGGALTVAEATRNLACTGATPLAVTDCLNFGNPEKPEIFWQFRQAVLGMSEACRVLETPVVSGNVSFYNETNSQAVNPTPVVGAVGLLENVEQRCGLAFGPDGDLVYLLGPWPAEMGGSEYLSQIHGVEAGPVPRLDLQLEKRVQQTCRSLIASGTVRSAHDLAEGGLAVALAECCLGRGKGAVVELPAAALTGSRPDALLFGEGPSRIIISFPPEQESAVRAAAEQNQIPCYRLGRVGAERLQIWIADDLVVDLPAAALYEAWAGGIPRCLNQPSM